MTTFKIPAPPDGPVWLTDADGVVSRATAVGPDLDRWKIGGWPGTHTWPELLALGEVSDVHPDLPADDPLPWRIDQGDVVDATDGAVDLGAAARFIVKAVNAYGERLAGDGDDPDRALAQERARADAAEAEVIRRGHELAAVLGEVRPLLDCGTFSPEYIAARDALRARLDRAQ